MLLKMNRDLFFYFFLFYFFLSFFLFTFCFCFFQKISLFRGSRFQFSSCLSIPFIGTLIWVGQHKLGNITCVQGTHNHCFEVYQRKSEAILFGWQNSLPVGREGQLEIRSVGYRQYQLHLQGWFEYLCRWEMKIVVTATTAIRRDMCSGAVTTMST